MILYRALTENDLNELNSINKINCTLLNSYKDLEHCKNIETTKNLYDLCFVKNNEKALLSLIFGHVNGKLVNSAKRSPWISSTASYRIASIYSNNVIINQDYRRHILCFEVDDDKIINNANDFKNKSIQKGVIINLSKGKLALYRKAKIIVPFTTSNTNPSGDNFYISNYSKADQEYLICQELNPSNKKHIILSPKDQEELNNNLSNEEIEKEIQKTLYLK